MSREISTAELNQLRRNAKRASRGRSISHTQALDEQARTLGFSNWSTLARHEKVAAAEDSLLPRGSSSVTEVKEQSQSLSSAAGTASETEAETQGTDADTCDLKEGHAYSLSGLGPRMTATREELLLMVRICERFEAVVAKLGTATEQPRRIDLLMDLEACHSNGCPLDLSRMAASQRDFDLVHDVAGIHRHLDRATGKLGELFRPRFAAR